MSIQSFFTSPVPGQSPAQIPGKGTAASAQASTFGAAFAMFVQQNQPGGEASIQTIMTKPHKALTSGNPALSDQPSLDIAELLAADPELAKELEALKALGLDTEDEIAQILSLNQKAFQDVLKPLTIEQTDSISNDQRALPNILESLFAKMQQGGELTGQPLKDIVSQIDAMLGEQSSLHLTLTNLTPAQISALRDVSASLDNLPPDMTRADLAALKLKLAEKIKASLNAPSSALNGQNPSLKAADPANETAIDDALLLADLMIGLVQLVQTQKAQLAVTATPTAPAADAHVTANPLSLKQAMEPLQGQDAAGAETDSETAADGKTSKKLLTGADLAAGSQAKKSAAMTAQANPALQTATTTMAAATGSLFASMDEMLGLADELGGLTNGQSASASQSFAALLTQARSPAQPHPGVQMIATTLQKGAAQGETRTITLQMDPPEMGRVEIRMAFGKDKVMKAHIISEKPETHLMLQRDVHHLERALQQAGIETDGGGLSFELAQDGQSFGQNGSHDGSRNKAASGAGAEDEPDVIETTMTWHVDPETGHMRYDIWA